VFFRSLVVLALGSLALGQTAPGSLPSASAPSRDSTLGVQIPRPEPGASTIGPNDPVITVRGLCDPATGSKTGKSASSRTAADCKTVITRAQFESLANALQPEMAPTMKKKLAELYPTMIVMAHTARKRGYDKSPQFKELMQFSHLQVLSMQLNRAVQKQADNVPAADIEKYYKENSAGFEQLSLQRIFVPKGKPPQIANDKTNTAAATQPAKSDEDAAKKEAESLETRAAAGEDFDKLQKEAYDFAGIASPGPGSRVEVFASELLPSQRAILDLKPGEVSHVFAESNGFYIYKFLAKEQKPLDDKVREDIKSKLAHQRFQSTMDQLHKSFVTTLSDAYFGTDPAQAGPTHGMPIPRLTPPGAVAPAVSSGAPVVSPAAAKVQVPEATTAKPPASQPAEPPQ
jgi:parvulin-like peptidyl-prolyl isomerase